VTPAADDKHFLKDPVSDRDWTRGPADAAVTLVEYVDFQCPDCQNSCPVIERLLAEFGGRVRFVLRQFPLVSRHPLAQTAALASEAAGNQGKFWEMYRRMMEARGELEPDDLLDYAQESGLDIEQWQRDMSAPALAERIAQTKRSGVRSGVNGTPTLFVNGVRYEGETEPVREEELRAAIEEALTAGATASPG
jgi:protein-disulfide isomerase